MKVKAYENQQRFIDYWCGKGKTQGCTGGYFIPSCHPDTWPAAAWGVAAPEARTEGKSIATLVGLGCFSLRYFVSAWKLLSLVSVRTANDLDIWLTR